MRAPAGTSPTIGEIGEAAALARVFPRLPEADAALLGPGDDAAVIAAPDGRVVITTDTMIEGTDFVLAWSSPFELGFKAAASNLADVAAMGAVPTALVVALAVPPELPAQFLESFADGLREGCAELAPGTGVVGGDLTASTVLTIAVTALGDLEGRAPVLRSGARPGDVVAVSGSLGLAAEGLRVLFEQGTVDGVPDAAAAADARARHPEAVAAQLAPRPPIADGRTAALAGATAMLDVSDGLAIDARRLAAASGVAVDLRADAIGSRVALDGGEDHALLATFPDTVALPGGFRAIGAVREGAGVLVDGVEVTARGGWDPFAGWDGHRG